MTSTATASPTIELITELAPCTVVDYAWKNARSYEHVTGALTVAEAADAGITLRNATPTTAVLVLDRPGTCTAFVAVDLATCEAAR